MKTVLYSQWTLDLDSLSQQSNYPIISSTHGYYSEAGGKVNNQHQKGTGCVCGDTTVCIHEQRGAQSDSWLVPAAWSPPVLGRGCPFKYSTVSPRQSPATSHQQPLLISDFIQNTIFGGGEARRGNEVEECQKCSSPLIDVTLLATRLQRSSLRRPGLHFPDIGQSSPSTRHQSWTRTFAKFEVVQ